jgi:hypothetical protein
VYTISTGIDTSDRFLGCLWVLLTSWAALRTGQLAKPLNYFGLVIGVAGIVSSIAPTLNELGFAFGVGVIVWWIWLGIVMLRGNLHGGAKQMRSSRHTQQHRNFNSKQEYWRG